MDYSSQEFRDKSMNEGMLEACAGYGLCLLSHALYLLTDIIVPVSGLEWGGIAWAFLSIAQVLENKFSKNPFLSIIGAPRYNFSCLVSCCSLVNE